MLASPINFSIIIITNNRLALLKKCLASIQKQVCDLNFEIIIIINGTDPQSLDFLTTAPGLSFFHIKKTSPAAARNYGAKFSKKEWLLFLDDDVVVPPNYFNRALKLIENYNPDLFGGPDAPPLDSSLFERSLSCALSSCLTTANTRFRHKKRSEREFFIGDESNLILCHLWVKKYLFVKIKFNPCFFRNEENVFLYLAQERTDRIYHFPSLTINHYRKGNYYKLIAAVFSSGHHRMKSFSTYPGSFKPVYLTPIFFNLYLLSLLFLSTKETLLPLFIYLLANLTFSLYSKLKYKNKVSFTHLVIIQVTILIVYGLGLLSYLISFSRIRSWGIFFFRPTRVNSR